MGRYLGYGLLACVALAAASGSATGQPQQEAAQVIYLRDGNVFLYDLAEDHRVQLTEDGLAPGEEGLHYGPPVWLDGDTIAVVRYRQVEDGLGVDRQVLLGTTEGEWEVLATAAHPFDLGYDPSTGRLVYTALILEEDGYSGRVLYTQESGGEPEPIEGFRREIGEGSPSGRRIRFAPEGGLMLLPSYPDNPVDTFELLTLSGDPEPPLLSGARGGEYITDALLAPHVAFAAMAVWGESMLEGPGLYEISLEGTVIRRVAANVHSFGMSAALGLVVVEQDREDGSFEPGVLVAVPLDGGAPVSLRENGEWPDVWPR